ncbi:hypothetical protein SDC9_167314 [bioreactor metagenome]|uniref:Uncharacterized protein n=1 Tax=bioreactor metagenome TaxID=1076179 RepID=A0A645G297_9ZZZZ
MLAVTLHAIKKMNRAFIHGITAGNRQRGILARPEGRPPLVSVILVEPVNQPVQHGFHGGGAVPGVNRSGKYDAVGGQDFLRDLIHIVVNPAGEGGPILLADAAGRARSDLFVVEPDEFCFCSRGSKRIHKRGDDLNRIALFTWAAHEKKVAHLTILSLNRRFLMFRFLTNGLGKRLDLVLICVV